MLSKLYTLFLDILSPRRVKGQIDLRILIYREEGNWVAHCLELDIVGAGGTPEKAFNLMSELVEDHISFCFENKIEDKLFNPAPPEYWYRWLKSIPYRIPEYHPLPQTIRRLECGLIEEDYLVSSSAR
ncbi:MAG: hypothetical protein Q6354_03920 [Candidatus Brocadiales bacterium]|nr:hypothetical protein [Candidatus Brocadiales bacterium]